MPNNDKPDDSGIDSSAADEPTAMWDADALKGLGLEEASKAHQDPAPRAAPVARAEATRPAPVATAKPVVKKRAAKKSQGPSWAAVVGLAAAVGVGVYALVRYLLS